jgi:hypothetical protein
MLTKPNTMTKHNIFNYKQTIGLQWKAGWSTHYTTNEGGCFEIRSGFVYTYFPTHAGIQLQREAWPM